MKLYIFAAGGGKRLYSGRGRSVRIGEFGYLYVGYYKDLQPLVRFYVNGYVGRSMLFNYGYATENDSLVLRRCE